MVLCSRNEFDGVVGWAWSSLDFALESFGDRFTDRVASQLGCIWDDQLCMRNFVS
jgi:hypothetical protein